MLPFRYLLQWLAFGVILCLYLTFVPLTDLVIIIRFAALLHTQQFCEHLWLRLNPLCFIKSDEWNLYYLSLFSERWSSLMFHWLNMKNKNKQWFKGAFRCDLWILFLILKCHNTVTPQLYTFNMYFWCKNKKMPLCVPFLTLEGLRSLYVV